MRKTIMDTDTGKIVTTEELAKMDKFFQEKSIPIDEQLMTLKQRENMQVSKFDNRSALGKIRVRARNSMRNKPCPCGSGIKFKKCCWSRTC
jgi:uncharacterized protein YecA (UPF0149 family)